MINRRSSHNVETSTLCGSELAFNTDCVPNRQPKDARERKRMSAMKLSPRWHKLLLSVHVATAVSVLGTDLVLLVLGISSVRGAGAHGDPDRSHPLRARAQPGSGRQRRYRGPDVYRSRAPATGGRPGGGGHA